MRFRTKRLWLRRCVLYALFTSLYLFYVSVFAPVTRVETFKDGQPCESLIVRTQFGQQSSTLNNCKTPKLNVRAVCLPLCGSSRFSVSVAESSGNDRVQVLPVKKCTQPVLVQDESLILVVFKMTRVFNGFHMYHVLNNFVVNLDPKMRHRYVYHCWDCAVTFSEFFDKVLNLNTRRVTTGCYKHYVFLGEHYTTYNVSRYDEEKASRWRAWAEIFQHTWCPTPRLHYDDQYFTLLDRRAAQNGRNLNNCALRGSHTQYVVPSLQNVRASVAKFCNSRVLVSAEGNGLTNMLLMPIKSTIVVIWQSNRPATTLEVIYGNMAKLLGMNMVAIPVESDAHLNANCSGYLNELFERLF